MRRSIGIGIEVVRAAFTLERVESVRRRFRDRVLAAAFTAALLALLVGYLFARRVTQPLTDMTRTAETVAAGGRSRTRPTGRTDEIGDLSRSLSLMESRMHERLELLRAERNKLVAVLAGMVEGVVAVDRDERILHLNEAAGRMLNLDPEFVWRDSTATARQARDLGVL